MLTERSRKGILQSRCRQQPFVTKRCVSLSSLDFSASFEMVNDTDHPLPVPFSIWRVMYSPHPDALLSRQSDVRSVSDYSGRTWCVQVPTGLIIAGSGGEASQRGRPNCCRAVLDANCGRQLLGNKSFLRSLPQVRSVATVGRVSYW